MKIKKLKKTIIINAVISLILIASFIAITMYIFNLNNISLNKINQIKIETGATSAKTSQNNQKLIKISKYEEKWQELSPQEKSTKTLKSTEVKQIVDTISEKYHIIDMQFAMKVPKELNKGKFKKDSIKIYLTSGAINFGATDDIKSLKFIQELLLTLPGNIIIEKLILTKSKEYTKDDYIAISKNGNLSKIRGQIEFHWYSKREDAEKSTD